MEIQVESNVRLTANQKLHTRVETVLPKVAEYARIAWETSTNTSEGCFCIYRKGDKDGTIEITEPYVERQRSPRITNKQAETVVAPGEVVRKSELHPVGKGFRTAELAQPIFMLHTHKSGSIGPSMGDIFGALQTAIENFRVSQLLNKEVFINPVCAIMLENQVFLFQIPPAWISFPGFDKETAEDKRYDIIIDQIYQRAVEQGIKIPRKKTAYTPGYLSPTDPIMNAYLSYIVRQDKPKEKYIDMDRVRDVLTYLGFQHATCPVEEIPSRVKAFNLVARCPY